QVNHRVARKLALTELPSFFENLLRRAERAMRLLIPERPERRHLRVTSDLRIFIHHGCRFRCADHEQIEGERPFRLEDSVLASQVERSGRLMDEHRPSGGANDKRDGNLPAMRGQLVSALPAAHLVELSAAIELRSALPEAKD